MSFDSQRNDVDAAVERVLAGVRETRVPEGLEARVAAAVRAYELESVRGGVRGWVWAAAAVAIAVGALVPVMWCGRHGEVAVKQVPAPVREAARPVVSAALPEPVGAKVAGVRERAVRVRRADVRAVAGKEAEVFDDGVVDPVIAEGPVPAATRAVDAEALVEANAPSRPAPPEPLTAEERRLRRVAVHGTAEQRAALNPAMRAKRYEAAKQAVMEFFEPPKPADAVQE